MITALVVIMGAALAFLVGLVLRAHNRITTQDRHISILESHVREAFKP